MFVTECLHNKCLNCQPCVQFIFSPRCESDMILSVMTHIRKKINTAIRDIYKRYDSFVQRGSGWVLKKVFKFSVSIMKFKLFQGGCLSALLPRELHKKCCCVSIKNIPKNKCFFYCVAAALCENTKNKYRKSKQHDKIIELLPFDNMKGPVSIREIKYLEKNSCVSVNVYGCDKIPYPYYISEFVKKLYHVNVLFHNNHYYLIRNMSTFASGEKSNRRKCYCCVAPLWLYKFISRLLNL